MMGQVGKQSMTGAGAAANPAPSGAAISGASSGVAYGADAPTHDLHESSTDPKFGKIFSEIQAKYGEKTEKPREIKKTLGKDDFLHIMITQMRHQDPTSPFKAEQFASEVAQFTNVEQLQNLNQKMERMTNSNQPLERLAMTNLIGKSITIDRERFVHTEGQVEPLAFSLGKDAASAKATVVSDAGEVVFEKDLGALKKGENNFNWDGLKTNTMRAKTGSYTMKIEAKDGNGATIPGQTQVKTRVAGVSFEGSEPVFLVGDINHPEKVAMKNIVRIESESGSPLAQIPSMTSGAAAGTPAITPEMQKKIAAALSGAGSGEGASEIKTETKVPSAEPVPEPPKAPNLFTFQKGMGSSPVDAAKLPSDSARALERYQQEQLLAKTPPQAPAAGPEATGFPNGMSEYNQPKGR